MKTSILMVSYKKDYEFACYAMKSVTKFATGFYEKVMVVPLWDLDLFHDACKEHNFRLCGFSERPGKGMLHHQVIICEADIWCLDAEAILHQDSDCLFTAPVSPEDYLCNGKPILHRERYDDFKQWGHRYSWKKCVLDATGIDPEWETMCRHPSVHLPKTYRRTRALIEQYTIQDWREYILSCHNEFPQTFAEFPTLGAVALKYFEDDYCWVDKKGNDLFPAQPIEKMKSFWSHGGLDHECDRHPGQTARQLIATILS